MRFSWLTRFILKRFEYNLLVHFNIGGSSQHYGSLISCHCPSLKVIGLVTMRFHYNTFNTLVWAYVVNQSLFLHSITLWTGEQFADAESVKQIATKTMKEHSQNEWQQCFEHLYKSWGNRIVAGGDYFERKEICTFLTLFNKNI